MLERAGIPPRACKEADTPGWQPLPDLAHTSDSGSGSEDEGEAGKHGPKYERRNIEANLSGISKKTRKPPQYRPKKMKNQGLKETMILRDLTETARCSDPRPSETYSQPKFYPPPCQGQRACRGIINFG